jgi:hypothetical protein
MVPFVNTVSRPSVLNLVVGLAICFSIIALLKSNNNVVALFSLFLSTILKNNPDGSLVRWEYSPAVARTELCRLIAREDLPLWFGESDHFQEYIIKAHNPKFVKSSRQTTTRDLIRLYNECVLMLIESFKSVHQFL